MKPALAALVALAFAGTAIADTASPSITVTGTGKMTYVPNMATVSVSVVNEAPTAADAWAKNAKVVKKLFDVLKEFGITEKDFKTTGLNINPRYVHHKGAPPELVGYTATYDLAITARDLKRLGALLDQLVANGANRGMGISFGIDNPEEMLDQARLRAVSEARRKADLYVKGAGANLGRVLNISEGQAHSQRVLRFEHNAPVSADSLMIAAGQQELSVSVTVTYAIRNS